MSHLKKSAKMTARADKKSVILYASNVIRIVSGGLNKIIPIVWTLLAVSLLWSCSSRKNRAQTSSVPVISVTVPDNVKTGYGDGFAPETIALLKEANGWLGVRYVYGGNSKDGVDCSGFVLQVFDKALGIKLPRSSAEQSDYCQSVKKKELVVGDLIFFNSSSGKKISHVGMYVGDDKMIHASTSQGVTVTSLSSDYYVRHLHSYGRVAPYFALITDKKHKTDKKKVDLNDATEEEKLRSDLERVLDEKTDSIISDYFN